MSNQAASMQCRIFISHQWRDKQIADRLSRDLEEFADVWVDYRRLRPGDRIQDTIDDALSGVDLVLLIWTEHSAASDGVRAEIDTSLCLGLRIVPCIFDYDDDGNPRPPLEEPLRSILGIDFHHYGSGLAQIADLILVLQKERVPAAARLADHPGTRMLTYLKGYLSYLSNYRNLRGVQDERAQWVDRIIGEIERYVEAGGDASSVRVLLEVARNSTVDDPEGMGMLVWRLERLLGEGRDAKADGVSSANKPRSGGVGFQSSRDELARRLAEVVPAGTLQAWVEQVNNYIDLAPVMLQALTGFAQTAGSPAGVQVVQALQAYLENADDLIPDREGAIGRLDDAWLILNTTHRLVESGLVPATAVPANWPAVAAVDSVVCAVLPPDVLTVLTDAVFQMLQLIAAEVASYQPAFTPVGHGYTPTMGAAGGGGSWEDQMNSMLLGTGLSVDGGPITH
ncbi:toll/interleukin-1 receptor domain-containing protein [Thioalkalivibrio sp.]|uniref:toll/interleukin-1 receptor domain-containing protein n=1 Tax=Thioalkalivibrio sp. TaxID=2093813 RepID=UPI003975FBE0